MAQLSDSTAPSPQEHEVEPCGVVFVISSDPAVRDSVAELVAVAGLRSEGFASLEAWHRSVPPERAGCLVVDLRPEDFDRSGLQTSLSSLCASRPVLVLIDRGEVPLAVRAIKAGVADVLEKPCRDERLLESIRKLASAAKHHGRTV